MIVAAPTEAEYAALAAAQAHRQPAKYTFAAVGDGGVQVRLPFVLGMPSGACEMPPGGVTSPAWERTVAITMQVAPDGIEVVRELATDGVLYPDPVVLDQVLERWPGLIGRIVDAVKVKAGTKPAMLRRPDEGEKAPAAIATMLVQCPRAAWRRLSLPGAELVIVVDPPSAAAWDFFTADMRKDDVRTWPLVRALSESSLRQVVQSDGAELSAAALVKRWPGAALHVMQVVADLVGVAGGVELGGW